MSRIVVFQQVSLDGYFVDSRGDMMWAKEDNDEESDAFASENASSDGVLAFGRVTYEMMASFWPSPQAYAMLPIVAEYMNARPKIVFSQTLQHADWNNTTIVRDDPAAYLGKLKKQDGQGIAILGSGSIVAHVAPHALIDEYQLMVCPLVLGSGRTMFEGVPRLLRFELNSSRVFSNGKVFLSYVPRRNGQISA